MSNYEFSPIEKEMMNFDFNALEEHKYKAIESISSATSVADISSKICDVWSKIKKYVRLAENIPFVGKYVKIIADLLDSFCAA